MKIPKLTRIRVFPFKSLPPIECEQIHLTQAGALANDRRFAFQLADGSLLNTKREPRMLDLRLRASDDGSGFTISKAQEGSTITVQPKRGFTALEDWVHRHLGYCVRVVENDQTGFPDDLNASGPTLISTATLTRIASWFPALTLAEVRNRFRTNLEISEVPPFWEDRLIHTNPSQGILFRVGDRSFLGVNPCQRCAVPSRDSVDGTRTPQFAKLFAEKRTLELPDWSPRNRFDHFYRVAVNTRTANPTERTQVQIGNPVEILGSRPLNSN